MRSLSHTLVRQSRLDRDLDVELLAYVERVTERHVQAGLSPAAARRAALLECEGIEPVATYYPLEQEARRTGRSFMDRTIPADGACYYVVRAIDANGAEGNASAPAMLTIEVGWASHEPRNQFEGEAVALLAAGCRRGGQLASTPRRYSGQSSW